MPDQNPEPELDIEAIKGLSPEAARIRVHAMQSAAKTPEEVQKAKQLQILLREKEFAFNQPHAKADYDYWSKAPFWELGEATALAHGRNPEIVTPSLMERFGNTSVLAAHYNRTYNLVVRAYQSGEISQQVKPIKFLEWARRKDITIPEELAEYIERRANPAPKPKPEPTAIEKELEGWKFEAQSWKKHLVAQKQATECADKIIKERDAEISVLREEIAALKEAKEAAPEEKTLSVRERKTLLKIILGMARDGYRYDHLASKSPVPKEIADALDREGIMLDVDTVRNKLKEAAELLPNITE